MKLRPLGRTGIEVSLVGLGTMTWGEQNTEAEAHAQLDCAVDHGVTLLDAAEMYPVPPRAETQGRTEAYLGSWLKKSGKRNRVIVATKVTGPSEFQWIRGGTRPAAAQVHAAVTASLQRLRTDVIDLYQVHWPDRNTNYFGRLGYTPSADEDRIPIEETLGALAQEVQQGRIRHVGISNESPWGVAEYLRLSQQQGWPRIASIQNPYSLLNRSFEVGLAEFAHREHVGLLAYSPLAFGVLSGKYLDGRKPEGARLTLYDRFQRYTGDGATAATQAYVELANAHGLDPAQMALAFVHSRPFVSSTLIGATTLTQLESNLRSAELVLSAEVLKAIEDIHRRCPYPCP